MENVVVIKNMEKNIAITISKEGTLLNVFHINNNHFDNSIKLTPKQRELIKEVGLNVDDFVSRKDLIGLEEGIIGYITSVTDNNGEVPQEGQKYEQLLDDIYNYNEIDDYEPKFI